MANQADGKIRFNSSTERLYVLYDTKSVEITDFIFNLSESQIRNLTNPSESKLYLATDSHIMMFYNNDTWCTVTTTGPAAQVQADWAEVNDNSKSYIKNKPIIDTAYDPTSENAQSGLAVADALKTIEVDKIYSPTSENAQSGLAVADALSNIHVDTVYDPASENAQSGLAVADALKTVHIDIASTTKPGTVMPDGTTIKIETDGTIHGAMSIPILTYEEYESLPDTKFTDDTFRIITDLNSPVDDNLANRYKNTATYKINDYCIYNGVLYKCISDITSPENFNNSHWKTIKIADEIQSDISEITSKVDSINSTVDELNKKVDNKLGYHDFLVTSNLWVDSTASTKYPYEATYNTILYSNDFVPQYINIIPSDGTPFFTEDETTAMSYLNNGILFTNTGFTLYATDKITCNIMLRIGGN